MKYARHATNILLSTVLAGCASSAKDVSSNYVSPLLFQSYDCERLLAEAWRVQYKADQLGSRLNKASTNDAVITVASGLLFWPGLFFLGGTKNEEAEFARLKGTYDAIQQAASEKKCPGLSVAESKQ